MRNKLSGIYSFTNKTTGKRYIGQTVYLNGRKGDHLLNLRRNQHDNNYLQKAFNKYGEEDFIFEVLEVVPKLEDSTNDKVKLTEREQYWMDFYKSYDRDYGYNINPSASINPMQGKTHTPEARKKISEAAYNRPPRKVILPTYIPNPDIKDSIDSKFEYTVEHINGNTYILDDNNFIDFCRQLHLDDARLFRCLYFKEFYYGLKGSIKVLNKWGEYHIHQCNTQQKNAVVYRYYLKDETGTEHITDNLNNFCRINRLSRTHMGNVVNKNKYYKGWTGYKVSLKDIK